MTDTLNTLNIWTNFGLIIQTGTAKLLEFPERKIPLSNDWADENGTEYELNAVYFKDKEIVLNCAFIADNDTVFWQNYTAFFNELTKTGYQKLYISDHGQTYDVFYKKTSNWVKMRKRLKNVEKVFVKFELILQVK